jgi:hypothetical protein
MITIIGNGDPMPTRSVSEPWAKAGEMNIEYTPRISLLGPLPAKERWYRAEIGADYSGRRPNCNAADRRPAADLAEVEGAAGVVSHPLRNINRSSIFALSHFRTENRIPLFLKML